MKSLHMAFKKCLLKSKLICTFNVFVMEISYIIHNNIKIREFGCVANILIHTYDRFETRLIKESCILACLTHGHDNNVFFNNIRCRKTIYSDNLLQTKHDLKKRKVKQVNTVCLLDIYMFTPLHIY